MRFEFKFSMVNPIAVLIYRHRERRYINLWNSKVDYVQKCIADDGHDPYADFKWTHLLKQEMRMWLRIGSAVTQPEFTDMIKTRGFNLRQSAFLEDLLRECGLAGWKQRALIGPTEFVYWNPYNKVIQDHKTGAIDIDRTNAERSKREG